MPSHIDCISWGRHNEVSLPYVEELETADHVEERRLTEAKCMVIRERNNTVDVLSYSQRR
jgi:hypothetical protein